MYDDICSLYTALRDHIHFPDCLINSLVIGSTGDLAHRETPAEAKRLNSRSSDVTSDKKYVASDGK